MEEDKKAVNLDDEDPSRLNLRHVDLKEVYFYGKNLKNESQTGESEKGSAASG